MQLLWLKRNLRLQDSEPLFYSMKEFRTAGPVLPLYIHDPGLINQPDVSRQHQVFLQETLTELASELHNLGGQLLEAVGDSVAVLNRIHQVRPLTKIWTHRETTQHSQYLRDKQVRVWCQSAGVELVEMEQNGIARGSQEPLPFAEYFTRCVNQPLRDPTGNDLSRRFAPLPFSGCAPGDIPAAAGDDKPLRQKGGRAAAQEALEGFFTIRNLNRYPFQLSSPNTAWDGCSRMSTWLAYGVVSDREVYQHVDRVISKGSEILDAGGFQRLQDRGRFYLDRLSWRRQYLQTFENHPEFEFDCILPQFSGVREAQYDEALFQAWKTGRTGFPFIDAAMGCLRQTGWINMRLRATVVSFATMNLWLPTTKVAEFLATEFLDYDPGIHHIIHQIVAGSSAFRGIMVYDPVKQGLDHDPKGQFIHRWVPELADLGADVHDLSKTAGYLSVKATKHRCLPYPQALVDHQATALHAKRRIHELKKGITTPMATVPDARDSSPQMGLF
ncbi:MAG: deoxyribodipyrimidine photo-lyase/cryptochrome family protein [Halomonadaceae bacterium]|nr:MAG: deoxyribodipyrimidine photo-lyase/cryptochrome family protein [Halomonadaceae bacterium]